MKVENFIARRYLFSKHRLNFITIISYLSISGITIGVAALIVVLSVFNGFSGLVKSFLQNFDPHVRIEAASENSFRYLDTVDSVLAANPEIESYTPFVSNKALAVKDDFVRVIEVKGIDPEKAGDVYGIDAAVVLGEFDLSEVRGIPGTIIGLHLADRLRALRNDTITIISPSGIEKSITNLSMPKTRKFLVNGIFSSNNNEYDAQLIFTDLEIAQRIFGYGRAFQGYELRLSSIDKSNEIKQKLEEALPENMFIVTTWFDFHKELYSVMQIERWTAYIILSLIIAVATFNILASLTMSVVEKKRDIGILRTMGMRESSIKKVFMREGIFVGVIGTFAGFILGFFVYWLQVTYKFYPLDPMQYRIDHLPMEISAMDFVAVGLASLTLSFLAAWYPSTRAAKVNPLDAIRWE